MTQTDLQIQQDINTIKNALHVGKNLIRDMRFIEAIKSLERIEKIVACDHQWFVACDDNGMGVPECSKCHTRHVVV